MSDSRKILKATYYPRELFFKIPKNIDLEDKSRVEGYWVKWDTLHINFVDGTSQSIESCLENEEDYKRPTDIEIEDRDDYGWFSDSEEEDEVKDDEEDDDADWVKQDTLDLVNEIIDGIKDN